MAGDFAFLDTGPLGLARRRLDRDDVKLIYISITVLWLNDGVTVVLPEIADYELRRELIRSGATSSLRTLDALRNKLVYLPLNTGAMHRAAGLWAQARGLGQQTADDKSLDADVILAAQALEYTGLGDKPVVITDNQRHLNRFVTTSSWKGYMPSRNPTP
jgi:predicted nucleic acid-binding protein